MRYIYVDEAGIAEHEPVTVVVGLIVDADRQYQLVEERLAELLNTVPREHRSGFVSHATSIWSNPKYREGWSPEERLEFIQCMAGIPRELRIPVSVAFVRRTNPVPGAQAKAQVHHQYAFGLCIAHADGYIRRFTNSYEVATVVAEDVPEMRASLRKIARELRDRHTYIQTSSAMSGQASTAQCSEPAPRSRSTVSRE